MALDLSLTDGILVWLIKDEPNNDAIIFGPKPDYFFVKRVSVNRDTKEYWEFDSIFDAILKWIEDVKAAEAE